MPKQLKLRIYEDGFSPSVKQLGEMAENAVKTFRRKFFSSVDKDAALFDRESLERKLCEKVKKKNRIPGHPQILIPAIEGLILVEEETLLSEFFINLLAKSIDRTKQKYVHPAFSILLKQLSQDEAIILFYLKKQSYKLKLKSNSEIRRNPFSLESTVENDFPAKKLDFGENFWLYVHHLISQNLISMTQFKEPETIFEENIPNVTFSYFEIKPSEFGEFFLNICVPDKFKDL